MRERHGVCCSHQSNVNGVTGGPERVVCNDCGDGSDKMSNDDIV
jgi:hypothetical protein